METALVAPAEDQSALVPLNEDEQRDLIMFEEIIGRGIQSFVEVGRALQTVRDGRLYRAEHDTFEDYCRQRWQIGRAHAHRYIDASAVARILSPVGDIPAKESQIRPLTRVRKANGELDGRMIVKLWARAVERASIDTCTGAKVITAKDVEHVVRPLLQRRHRLRQVETGFTEPIAYEPGMADSVPPAAVDGSSGQEVTIAGEELAELRQHVDRLARMMIAETVPYSVRGAIEGVCDIVLGANWAEQK